MREMAFLKNCSYKIVKLVKLFKCSYKMHCSDLFLNKTWIKSSKDLNSIVWNYRRCTKKHVLGSCSSDVLSPRRACCRECCNQCCKAASCLSFICRRQLEVIGRSRRALWGHCGHVAFSCPCVSFLALNYGKEFVVLNFWKCFQWNIKEFCRIFFSECARSWIQDFVVFFVDQVPRTGIRNQESVQVLGKGSVLSEDFSCGFRCVVKIWLLVKVWIKILNVAQVGDRTSRTSNHKNVLCFGLSASSSLQVRTRMFIGQRIGEYSANDKNRFCGKFGRRFRKNRLGSVGDSVGGDRWVWAPKKFE